MDSNESASILLAVLELLHQHRLSIFVSSFPAKEVHHFLFFSFLFFSFLFFSFLFFSAGTICVAEIKQRKYTKQQLNDWGGAKIDAGKARSIFNLARQMNAIPVVINCTRKGEFIISDLRKGQPQDVQMHFWQTDDFNQQKKNKEVMNLSGCTIN